MKLMTENDMIKYLQQNIVKNIVLVGNFDVLKMIDDIIAEYAKEQ